MYKKEISVSNYFDIHNFYTKIYGKMTIILMQVGSFHECYATDKEGSDLFILEQQLDMKVACKDKKRPLYMVGAPIYTIDDFTEKLINLGYTVVVIDQTTEPPKPKREITGIYSPTTFLNKTDNYSVTKTKILSCLIIDIIKIKSEQHLYIGIASYDITTGEGSVYETIGKTNDPMYCLDDIVHYMENYPPCEVILHTMENVTKYFENNKTFYNMTLNNIISYLELSEEKHKLYKIHNIDNVKKISFQKELYDNIFKFNSNISAIDELGLSQYNMARLALAGLLNHVVNHQQNLLNKLKKPYYYTNNEKLFLGNKALEQLDIIPMSGKPKTLFDIINQTKTTIGKRFLKDSLATPLVNTNELNYRYDLIDKLLQKDIMKDIADIINDSYDIMKLNRRIVINKINPLELYNCYITFKKINNLNRLLKKKHLLEDFGITRTQKKDLANMLKSIETTFDMDYIVENKINFINYNEESKNYIINNKYPNLNDLQYSIENGEKFMTLFIEELRKVYDSIDTKLMKKKEKTNDSFINLKCNERDGHYLLMTQTRCKILRKELENKKYIIVANKRLEYKDIEFTDMPRSSYTKIFCKEMKTISTDIIELKTQLANEIKNNFYIELQTIYCQYEDIFNFFADKLGFIDFINSGAICSSRYGYCKPNIEKYTNSFIDAENLRHPIVEILSDEIAYQPHNITLGKDKYGILLYGINSSGKSTLMKSIGLNIVMAQIGYYTSATKFTFFPYTNLFTRIVGNDNIFKGMSSFIVEMMELMAILKRNNNTTLVIADEICRGTEEKSANIIVAYMLETLEKSQTTFITATHLHRIANMDSVKKLTNVKPMHLKVELDSTTNTLIYSRKLEEGQGEMYYGVMVAKYMMKNDEFNKRSLELENEYDDIIIKQSNYNKDLWMKECYLCKSTNKLETHHINFQKDCNKYYVIDKPNIKKNSNANLIVLCSKCHDMIDCGKIVINGWYDTNVGKKLDYKYI